MVTPIWAARVTASVCGAIPCVSVPTRRGLFHGVQRRQLLQPQIESHMKMSKSRDGYSCEDKTARDSCEGASSMCRDTFSRWMK